MDGTVVHEAILTVGYHHDTQGPQQGRRIGLRSGNADLLPLGIDMHLRRIRVQNRHVVASHIKGHGDQSHLL